MSAPKKFGTFSGVFTPAILTILGVIMYMRLPWIVGQAGLYSAVGIIILAHVISVTTGLSVASISTDKRVKTGGTYYMISRSLGLPIGGTLGLALFVGLSFSVSLYLIGFSESFLGFWGFSTDKNMIRLAGSIALLGVTIITFISTSLALKTQFFILLAIILSLGSILLGRPDTVSAAPQLHPIATSAPFIVLFGIFFPAVTGFEAGVSMSGDLKDPKRSIPSGTIIAIVVGLVVYLGMAAFFAFRVPSDQLVNNPNVLLDIALFSPLVVAGIWGATLSSALGSILGAPRILQAVSNDKITPRFFGKGFGKGNEPRNALLLTFLLAEAGILVGELDVIARVVSMFFITTYGFLNMSCAIENWASPDFRPDFRVSRFVSIIGSITCVIVMIQLDLVAMIGATVLLGSLFFYLKRKELTLESGDTWEGVWSSVIREGLNRLNRDQGQQRNWRPNIILFSGGSSVRPQLVDLGKRLVNKRGILSNFDLIETEGAKTIFRKSEQSLKTPSSEFEGVFARRVECQDIYEAMETISKYYGFSGLEPNTVLMGWARNTKDPVKFVHLIQNLANLDYNLMLLNYDEQHGFGNHERIDIWWRGIGNAISFALSLCRFLTTSDEWIKAEIRFLIITEDSSMIESLHANMARILDDYRIEATIRVINNSVEQKPFYDIIKKESKDADLIINGIPDIRPGEEENYIVKTNSVVEYLGTVLLIRASSFFSQTSIGLEKRSEVLPAAMADSKALADESTQLNMSGLSSAGIGAMISVSQGFKGIHDRFDEAFASRLITDMEALIDDIRSRCDRTFQEIQKEFIENERLRNFKTMISELGDFLFGTQKSLTAARETLTNIQKEILETGINWVTTQCEALIERQPEHIRLERSTENLKLAEDDRWFIKLRKIRSRIGYRITKKTVTSNVRFQEITRQAVYTEGIKVFLNLSQNLILHTLQIYPEIQRMVDQIVDSLNKTATHTLRDAKSSLETLLMRKDKLDKLFEQLSGQLRQDYQNDKATARLRTTETLEKMINEMKRFDSHKNLVSSRKVRRERLVNLAQLSEIPEIWRVNHQIMRDTVHCDLTLLTLKNRVATIIRRDSDDIMLKLKTTLIDDFRELRQYLEEKINQNGDSKTTLTVSLRDVTRLDEAWETLVEEIRTTLETVPESMDIVRPDSLQLISEDSINVFEMTAIPFRRLIEFYFESEFIGPMETFIDSYEETITRSVSVGHDIIRLVSLNVDEIGKEKAGEPVGNIGKIFSDASVRVCETIDELEQMQNQVDTDVDTRLGMTMEKLNLYEFSTAPDYAQLRSREKKENKSVKALREKLEAASQAVSRISTRLIYRASDQTRQYSRSKITSAETVSKSNQLIEFLETISPKASVTQALPFYYRHLFLGKPSITREFWVGREEELRRAARAITRHRAGTPGALLITGEPGSGKSSLSRYIAQRQFEKQKAFVVTSPDTGTTDISVFERHFQTALDSRERLETAIRRLPANSVIVLDDIGKWWSRKEDGFKIIEKILKILDEFSSRCFFIVNLDLHVYRFLSLIYPIADRFADIIAATPFETPQLKEIIMLRHKASGLKFSVQGEPESNLSEPKLARLFTRVVRKSQGNVSRALVNWVRSIESIQKDQFTIGIPRPVNVSALKYLDPTDQLILIQFLLQGGITQRDITDIILRISPLAGTRIDTLKKMGILRLRAGNSLQIDPFILPYLMDLLATKGLL